ncbi:hypothetical protein ACWEFL_20745 [Streptomyces sp. NPDC004838]
MRELPEEARELLALAAEVARIRDAPECTSRDLAIAAVAQRLIAKERDPEGAPPGLSPEMLPFGPSLERLLTEPSGEPVSSGLLEIAARENPDLAEYLGTG